MLTHGPVVAEPNAELLGSIADALRANLARGFLEGEERIRQIAEALSDAVVLTDDAGTRVLFVNAAYEQIWGRPRDELYRNPLALFEGVHPEDRERVRDVLLGQPARGYDIEFRILRPAGDERFVWSRGFPVLGVNGETNRVATIIEDITERRLIAESHERLIRGFTHDVRNPLGAADGYLSLLEMGVLGPISETQSKSIASARRSIHSALDLVTGLLEIERAEAGQLSIHRESVDSAAVIAEITEEFHAAAEAKHSSLVASTPFDDNVLVIESDGARVRQILANLVSNAVKYTQSGGRIGIVARIAGVGEGPRRGPWVNITVSDNGPGIPSEKHSLVFREFTRFDPAATSGSGIGLAISRRVARALGGEITFTSAAGIGSAFTLWLPLAEASP